MKYSCPACSHLFLPENINIQTDLALCKGCGQIARISELSDDDFKPIDLQNPPKGAWYRQSMSEAFIGATTRHPSAFFLVPFMCVWSGGSMGGIYGSQIAKGEFNLFMSLFGLPFFVGTLFLGGAALMAICGKVEVRLQGRQGVVFIGVGRLGWNRRFNLDEFESITDEGWGVKYPGSTGGSIVLKGKRLLRFATNISEERRYFMLNALKQIHARKLN